MVKALLLLIILSLFLVSGCSTDTGNVIETTKLAIPETPSEQNQAQSPESIEELHREFAEFEESQAENLSAEQDEIQEVTETTEEIENATEETTPEEEAITQNEPVPECPSCEDNNPCTTDSCSEDTEYECVHEAVIPCCGNSECEEDENWSACPEDCECSLECGPCETLEDESCSCLPKTECVQDGCCPGNCTYLEDSDCPRPSLVFSEIYYNPSGSDSGHEWIEIYNNGAVPIDVSKLRFEESGTQHMLKNTSGNMLSRNSYSIIADNPEQFLLDYPDYSGLLFDSSFSLSNTGEELILRAGKDGDILDAISYNSTWGGDGTGFSIEKIDLNGPNTQENWNQSSAEKGTPGQKNSIAA